MVPPKKLFLRLGLLLGTTVVTLVVAEAVFRRVLRHRYAEMARGWSNDLFVLEPESDIVFSLAADKQRENTIPGETETWTYTTNTWGFRGPEPRMDDSLRVLAIGDSYTFGWAANDDEVWPRVLERLLAQRPGAAPVEVLNCGVPGYNTAQEAALLDRLWERVEPDLVLLGFVMNDAEPPRNVPLPPDLKYRFADVWLLEDVKLHLRERFGRGDGLLRSRLFSTRPYLDQFTSGQPERAASREALEAIATRCRDADVPLLVFVLPDFTALLDEGYAYEPIHALVRDWGNELGVPTFDLLPEFVGKDRELFGVPGDRHPNARAHRMFAEEMVEVVAAALMRE